MAFRSVIPVFAIPQPVAYTPRETHAAAASSGVTRRDFMKWMAASVALSGAACSGPPQELIYPYVDMPEGMVAGEPVFYATQWLRDGYAQGILVSTQMGRPVKIEGNPRHPANLGGTDSFMQAAVLQLWDPDRSQSVMQGGARRHEKYSASPSTWNAFETAWRERSVGLSARQGEGFRVLTGPLTSPSTVDALQRLLQRYPQARWHRHAPLEAAGSHALRAVGNVPMAPVAHVDRAEVIAAFDCDPFGMGPAHLRHARDWATSRKAGRSLRLFALESQPGAFGAVAQQRIALAPAEIEDVLWRVARSIESAGEDAGADGSANEGVNLSANDGDNDNAALAVQRFENALTRALLAAPGRSLLIAGEHLSSNAQQIIHWLNHRLGNIGKTVDYIETVDAGVRHAQPLGDLVSDMHAGRVDALLMLGGNPVYDVAGAADFAIALKAVPFSAHLGLYEDETSALCLWHLPETHAIEAWGDARAFDGTTAIVQPAIAPLYDTRSALEVLALLSEDSLRSGHALVQRLWRQRIGDPQFEAFWHASLRHGFIADSANTPLPVEMPARPVQPTSTRPAQGALAARFAADPAVGDGSFSNNGWLQELPRPISKLTWDNAVLIGPQTAADMAAQDGDVVRIARGDLSCEAPLLIVPTHAENCVTLPLGYGRERAGRVGNKVGFNAYLLRPFDNAMAPVQITRTDRRHEFAITQREVSMHGRDIVRTVAAGKHQAAKKAEKQPSLYPEPQSPVHAWAMSIDLNACIGCSACTIACQAENNIPVVGKEEVRRGREMHWIRVDRYVARTQEKTSRDLMLFQPVPCMHCEEAPCEAVCPVGATVHDSEGLNVQVYNRCVGTRFCSNNCPYKVRRFNFLAYANTEFESLKALQNPDVTVRRRGVMEKCTYCVQRISRARIQSEKSGVALRDGDVVTACEAACPTQAIVFGDLRDAESRVSKSRLSERHYVLLEELNTRPRTTYLARVVGDEGGAA